MRKCKNIGFRWLFFPLFMWFASRMFICVVMLLITPLISVLSKGVMVSPSWHVFSAWDSTFYEQIATYGYDRLMSEKQFVFMVFFPLLPLLSRVLMTFGLPFEVAGTLVNNLAFLGAAIVLYAWSNERYGVDTAKWTTSVLTWCPLSLFGTVIYAEGLYLLFSTAALRAFDKKQYLGTAVWGSLATAARPTGIALIPALLLVTMLERRGIKAYLASLAAGSGLFLFSLYCQIKLGDALAFLHAQKAWRPTLGFDWLHWWKMLMQIVVGSTNWKHGYIKDPWHPLLFILIVVIGYTLWHFHKKSPTPSIPIFKLNSYPQFENNDGMKIFLPLLRVPRSLFPIFKKEYCFACLALFCWLLAGDPLTNVVMIFGGIYILWLVRSQMSLIAVVYGFCGIGMLLTSGGTISLNRLAYGIVSLSIALGLLLTRHPRMGYAMIGLFAIILASFAVRFAQLQWVA